MQGMTPLELKYHLKDVERSFAACQPHSRVASDRQAPRFNWLTTVIKWIASPPPAEVKHKNVDGPGETPALTPIRVTLSEFAHATRPKIL
jgi:hypothetical protein